MKRVLIAIFLFFVSQPALACGDGSGCELDDRSYQAKAPSGWNGKDPLPVLLHFHGWGRDGTNVIRNKRITDGTESNGVLLLAPDGIGNSWSFWGDRRDDIDFAKAVIEDAANRWPIDRTKIYISGFSYGSAMAWLLACDSGDAYAGVLGIAGTLSNISRRDCPTGAFSVRQVHGKKDGVMRPPWGGNREAWETILSLAGCGKDNKRTSTNGRFTRETWAKCKDGHSVALDVHSGNHWIPKGWIATQLSDLLRR